MGRSLFPGSTAGPRWPKMMTRRENPAIAKYVCERRGHQSGETGEQLSRCELGKPRASCSRSFQCNPNGAVVGSGDVVESHGGPQHILDLAFQAFSVSAVELRSDMDGDVFAGGEQALPTRFGANQRVRATVVADRETGTETTRREVQRHGSIRKSVGV